MNNGRKKILSLMLAFVMTLSLLPAAHAEDAGLEDSTGEYALQDTEASGQADSETEEEPDTPAPSGEQGAGTDGETGNTAPGVNEGGEDPGDGTLPEDGTTDSPAQGTPDGTDITGNPEGTEPGQQNGTTTEDGENPAADDSELTTEEGTTGDLKPADEEETTEETETDEEETTDEEENEEAKELPHGFAGMPEGYELSDEELAAKAALREHGLPDSMKDSAYEEYSVLLLTSDADYAATVAAAYRAELVGFYGNFAELQLTTATALEAVTAAADPEIPLPAVEPNWIVTLEPGLYDPELGGVRLENDVLITENGNEVLTHSKIIRI